MRQSEKKWRNEFYFNPIKVWCGECQEWFTQDKVQTKNIEEDYMGRDILTFECPECNSTQKSLRIG